MNRHPRGGASPAGDRVDPLQPGARGERLSTDRSGIGRIVVLTDLSPGSKAAMRCAARLACMRAASQLRLLHVLDPLAQLPEEGAVDALSDELVALQRLAGRTPVTPAIVIRDGKSVVDATIAELEAAPADLLVVTAERHGRSNAIAALLHRAPVDILCVRPHAVSRWPEQPARVLVGVDFSDTSRRALALANRIADGPVIAVHVVDHRADSTVATPFARDPFLPSLLRERISSWAGSLADEIRVAQGEVADRLLSIAAEEAAGVIVLGAEGVRDGRGLAAGRAPERVLAEAAAPVLLAR